MRPALVLNKMYEYEFNMEPGEHEREVLVLFTRAIDEWFHWGKELPIVVEYALVEMVANMQKMIDNQQKITGQKAVPTGASNN